VIADFDLHHPLLFLLNGRASKRILAKPLSLQSKNTCHEANGNAEDRRHRLIAQAGDMAGILLRNFLPIWGCRCKSGTAHMMAARSIAGLQAK